MLLALLFGCAQEPELPVEVPEVAAVDAPSTEAEKPSLYVLDAPFHTSAGTDGGLDVQRGHPTIFSMFYTSCPMACPLLIQDIQALLAGLPPEESAELRVVLVSLDPAHDNDAAMQEVIASHNLDARWTLGTVPEDRVREVAAALGVRYRPLPEGGFAHTAVLTLVDGNGRIVARSEGSEGREELVETIGQVTEGR